MPEFRPFAGLRYDPSRVDLDDVIAPPYDVISPAGRRVLAERSAAGSIHVELPEAHGDLDRYAHAAELLATWIADGTLCPEARPAFYALTMTLPDGRSTTGLIGAVGIDSDDVLPHEETMPKAKSDRLDLLRATRTNISPVWCLSLAAGLTATIHRGGPPLIDLTDDDGVRHQVWVIDEPGEVDAITAVASSAPLVIADGHHRFDTARTYAREVDGQVPGADAVMALVVELTPDQLAVGPIHRTLAGLPGDVDLPAAFAGRFDLDVVDGVKGSDPDSFADLAEWVITGHGLALLTPTAAWRLQPRPEAFVAAGSDLDASLVSLVLAELPAHELSHPHTLPEAVDDITSGDVDAVVLMRPVTVPQISDWAHARRRMPPKTTYFTPKPRTGLVFRALA